VSRSPHSRAGTSGWTSLYRVGGSAAVLAGILFRRNLAAEVAAATGQKAPASVEGWFALLQTNRLLGMTLLNAFDLVDYVLVAIVFVALYAALRGASRGWMAVATSLALLGAGTYATSSPAFSMLALSARYASAPGAQRSALLASGEAVLSLGRFTAGGAHSGTGGYMSLLLVALAGLTASLVMLRSGVFGKPTAVVGILAAALDLTYCAAYVLVPSLGAETLALAFIPAAGLLWMAWHIMAGWRLWRLGRAPATEPEAETA
jgi:hypothetical protein